MKLVHYRRDKFYSLLLRSFILSYGIKSPSFFIFIKMQMNSIKSEISSKALLNTLFIFYYLKIAYFNQSGIPEFITDSNSHLSRSRVTTMVETTLAIITI